jgi:hypothetical protein
MNHPKRRAPNKQRNNTNNTASQPGLPLQRHASWCALLIAATLVWFTFILAPMILAQDTKPSTDASTLYHFVNQTNGKFTDDQISWTFDGKTYTTLAEAKEAPAHMGPGGRLYFKMQSPGKNGAPAETYTDFIEFTQNDAGWFGNTTQVDAFVIPLTIEVTDADGTSKKVGITESRTHLFEAFKKETPKEFHSCVEDSQRIVSPAAADFGAGKAHADYFDAYIDQVWKTYATETKKPGGWTGKVVDGALTFTPPDGGKAVSCPRKPTSDEAFRGAGVLSQLPQFCAAINRHVLADPADWHNPAKYYLAPPANFYAKFWHDHSINGKAYGFCYDDVNEQDSLIHAAKPVKVIVTLYWDSPAGK